MASLNLIDSGIVYINPEPGYEYHFACHSHVVPLGGDDLLCSMWCTEVSVTHIRYARL
tara:strand:+ start:349 stop:522 length:174 start_codon:yes stop_codon:yes gene_type:complete